MPVQLEKPTHANGKPRFKPGPLQSGRWGKGHKSHVFVVSFGFLILLVLMLLALGIWAWFGSVEESVPGVGQIVPQGKLRRVMAPVGGVVSKVYVSENQEVKAGEILMVLDPEPVAVEKQGYEEQLRLLEEEANALAAASLGETFTGSGKVQSAWLQATRQAYAAQREEALMQIKEARHRHQEAQARVRQMEEVLKISEEMLPRYRALYAEGGLSRKELEEFEQRVNQQRGELMALREAEASARIEYEQSRKRPDEIMGTYHQDILSRLSDFQKRIAQIRTELAKDTITLKHQVIEAPIDGFVNEQAVRGPGDVVSAGQVLLNLVPKETQMVAEVRVTNRDLAYIHLNQRAALRLDAFPYEHFGRLYGTVTAISPSTQVAGALKTEDALQSSHYAHAAQDSMPYYVLTVKPDKTVMTYNGKSYPLRSGMTLSADIITREKNIVSFMIDPVRSRLDKAFRDPTNR